MVLAGSPIFTMLKMLKNSERELYVERAPLAAGAASDRGAL